MVVLLHCSYLGEINPYLNYLTVNGLFRIAVPLFLMINGYYFFTAQEKGNSSAWLKKIFIIYLAWTTIYSYFWLRPIAWNIDFAEKFAHEVFFGFFHLWYLPAMMLAAGLTIAVRNIDAKYTLPAVIVLFAAGVFLQYFANYYESTNTLASLVRRSQQTYRNFIFFAFPFFFIGFMLKKFDITQKISTRYVAWIALLGTVSLVLEAHVNYISLAHNYSFDNLISLIIVCPAIFLLFLRRTVVGNSKSISMYSTAIYFTHIAFVVVLSKRIGIHGLKLTLAVLILSVFASYFVIKFNKKFRYLL